MKLFQSTISTFLDGKLVFVIHGARSMREESPADKAVDVSWDNVDDVLEKYGAFLPFSIHNGWMKRTGHRRIEFDSVWFALRKDKPTPIKERKTSNPNIRVEVEWVETNPPIEDILKWPDADKAIQYLVERGLSLK